MTALVLTLLLLMVAVSVCEAAQTVVTNTCKTPSTPCEIVLETKSSGPGTAAVTVTSDASCDRYSTKSRPCVQTGISVDSTVVHTASNGTGPSHISSSVVVVSDGGSNTISESSQVPSSSSATTTRRIICSCTPTTVTSATVPPAVTSQRTTTPTISPRTVTAVVVADRVTTVPTVSRSTVSPVQPNGQYSDRMAKAIETAVKENAEFAEHIRTSRLAFNS